MLSIASLLCAAALALPQDPGPLSAPPAELVEAFELDPFYAKHLDAGGIPILASARVNDYALFEARYLIDRMLAGREDLRTAIAEQKVRFAIMAPSEFTTDVPEHSDLSPPGYWDRRARGLGATRQRPCVSCGEENLLGYPGDPYAAENILIHEFAHVVHEMGLRRVDETFQPRLSATYRAAMEAGLWEGKYAATNPSEYWAEGVQSWFDTNRVNDHDHNHVDTREELREYDPGLAALIEEVLGDPAWRYVRPRDRAEPAHLEGYDASAAPRFVWPERVLEAWRAWEASQQEERDGEQQAVRQGSNSTER